MQEMRNEMTELVSAATVVGNTLCRWSKHKSRRRDSNARCALAHFRAVRKVTEDVLGFKPSARDIDNAYESWLTWADRPSLKVAAAAAARRGYCTAEGGDLSAALREWRRVMRPPAGAGHPHLVRRPKPLDSGPALER